MKRVRRDVAHAWVHKLQSDARNATGSLYFNGDTIYSYGNHFPVARHVTQGVVFFTNRTYSKTTSAHCSEVRAAIPPDVKVFTVSDVTAKPGRAHLKEFNAALTEAVVRARNPRSRSGALGACDVVEQIVKQGNAYASAFKLKTRFVLPDDWPAVRALASARTAKADSLRDEKLAREAVRQAEKLEAWKRGESVRLAHSYGSPCFLRLRGDTVETSQHAEVPAEHVKRVLPVVLAYLRDGRAFEPNGHSIRVGEYTISGIDTAGTVRVGCHRFERSEVERFAAVLTGVA